MLRLHVRTRSVVALLAFGFCISQGWAQTAPPKDNSSQPPTIPLKTAKEHMAHCLPANYPAIARAAHIAGIVLIGVEVDTSGAVTKTAILSGPAMLQQPSLDAAKQCTFRPFEVNGAPAVVRTAIAFTFRLGHTKSDEP